jgi:2-methylcitrate dehydratase PrpD
MAILTSGVIPASKLVTQRKPGWLTQWSRFAADTSFADLPDEVVVRTKLVILDCLAAMIAGEAEREVASARKRLTRAAKAKRGGSPLIEAFLGGTAGTMLEIDEGNQYARGHPGIHVVPAVLAAAKLRPVSGQQAILAVALGYEIGARIGIASKLRVTMHPHGTWGTVGAALAIAKLNGASPRQFAEVINIASSLGLTTSRRNMLEGGTVRNTYAGFSNMLGMMAWEFAKSGFTGEADGVGSVFGGIAAEDWRPAEMTADLGARWEIARNYFKLHAACRYNHGALDALSRIVADVGGLRAADIASIRVETYVWAAQLDHPAPANMLAAKFSMPFSLATYIVNGSATLEAFRDSALKDTEIQALARRIRIDEDPALTAMLPGLRPARVIVTLKDGRVLSAEAMTNKGDTEDPYTAAEVRQKFIDIVGPVLGAARAQAMDATVMALESAEDLAAAMR